MGNFLSKVLHADKHDPNWPALVALKAIGIVLAIILALAVILAFVKSISTNIMSRYARANSREADDRWMPLPRSQARPHELSTME